MSKPELRLGATRDGFVLHVMGRASMRESLVAERVVDSVLENEQATLMLDLSTCEALDSTFIGSLLRMQERYGNTPTSRFGVISPSVQCMRLFGPSRLNTQLNIRFDSPKLLGEPSLIPMDSAVDPQTLGRHVVAAHRQLAALGDERAAVFASIVAKLERELENSISSKSSPE